MSHEIIWEKDGCNVIISDVLGNNFLQTSIKATTDPRFVNAKYAIVDFNGVTEFLIDANTIELLAESDIKAYLTNPNIKLAIIANKLVMTGITNMYKTYFELHNSNKVWDINIFESEIEAREWINS